MPHFWCGVMKLRTISPCRCRACSAPASIAFGIDRRLVDREALAERAHPGMVLVELLAPRQRPPRDQLVHVGLARIVADFSLSMPDQVGDEMTLRGCAWTSRKRIFSSSRGCGQMRVFTAGLFTERLPRLDGDFTVGLGREAEIDLARRRYRSRCCGRPLVCPRRSPCRSARQGLDLVLRLPADPLAAVAEFLEQRPERR